MLGRTGWGARAALAVIVATTGWVNTSLAADDKDAKDQQIERKLEAARARLEEAAREVADLSQQLAGPAMHDALVGQMFGGRRAILGINIGPRGETKVDGVYVAGVSPGGPADKAGIKSGDVIVALDGKRLMIGADANPNADLLHRMRDVKPGDKVKLQYLRDGKTMNAEVVTRAPENRVFSVHGDDGDFFNTPVMPLAPGEPAEPGQPPVFFGHFMGGALGDMELCALTPKLGSYFGTDKGVLVIRAPSADLKLEEGDVITAIDGRQPQSGSHALRILRSYQPGEKVKLSIMRAHKAQTLEVTLPDRAPEMAPLPPVPPAPLVPAAGDHT
jgi:C-terminal processing protease CtpA/Prc